MKSYLSLMQKVLDEGALCLNERTGHSTLRLIGPQLEFWVNKGFPIVTTRKIDFSKVATELDWFLQGNTNITYLKERKNGIWDHWAVSESDLAKCRGRDVYGNQIRVGDCGPIYGAQWTQWKTSRGVFINQLNRLLEGLKTHPFSRRHIVSAWNPEYLPDEEISPQMNVLHGKQCLAPCHTLFQVFLEPAPLWARLKDNGKEAYIHYVKTYPDFFKPVHLFIRRYYESWGEYHLKNTFCRPFYLKDSSLEEVSGAAFGDDIFSHEWELELRKLLDHDHLLNLHKILNEDTFVEKPKAYILHLKMYARSQDLPIGTAFNISSYSLLLALLAHEVNAIPGKYVHTMGDAHIYSNQVEKVKEQLLRDPLPLPELKVIEESAPEGAIPYFLSPLLKGRGLRLVGYQSHPVLKYPIAV